MSHHQLCCGDTGFVWLALVGDDAEEHTIRSAGYPSEQTVRQLLHLPEDTPVLVSSLRLPRAS